MIMSSSVTGRRPASSVGYSAPITAVSDKDIKIYPGELPFDKIVAKPRALPPCAPCLKTSTKNNSSRCANSSMTPTNAAHSRALTNHRSGEVCACHEALLSGRKGPTYLLFFEAIFSSHNPTFPQQFCWATRGASTGSQGECSGHANPTYGLTHATGCSYRVIELQRCKRLRSDWRSDPDAEAVLHVGPGSRSEWICQSE